jgi:hypothetical protein
MLVLAGFELAEADCAWVVELARSLGLTPEDSMRRIMDPLPSFSPPAHPSQVHRGRIISLRLAERLGSLTALPDLAPLTGLVSLDVHGTAIERLDLEAARSLEVLRAGDTPLAALVLPAAPSPFRWIEVQRTRLRSLDLSPYPFLECLAHEGVPLESIHACDLTARWLAELRDPPLASLVTTRPATAAELHTFAEHFNYDDDLETLGWVASHPACDLGTALLVYWRCDPANVRGGDDDFEQPHRDLLALVEARVAAGAYATAACPYDPVADGFGKTHMDNPDIPAALRRRVP